MTRLEKKCFLVSVGMHGLLLTIVVVSSAFRSEPPSKDIPILTMIPANIVEGDSAGGGSPAPAAPQPAPAAPQLAPTVAPTPVVPRPQPVAPKPVIRSEEEETKPREVERDWDTKPLTATEPAPSRHHKTHEIVPDFTPATSVTHKSKIQPSETAAATSESTSRADARRLRQRIAQAFEAMAAGVKNSGAQGTVVDMPGQGGGEAFVGYETLIYNAYYHAWVTPDSVANKLAATDVKIVVARDGTILSAEVVGRSGEEPLDRSVERVLRVVQHLPAFPAGARDEQRTFLIRFNLEAKEGAG